MTEPVPVHDTRTLRSSLGSFLTGITIVTTSNVQKRPVGLTVNSFTSVSLEPPLVLVCIAKSAASFPVFRDCESFAVNVLGDAQQELAKRFATSGGDKFAAVEYSMGSLEVPLISDSLAQFECTTFKSYSLGDHLVLVGSVVATEASDKGPLGYFRSKFVRKGEVTGEVVRPLPSPGQTRLAWIFEAADGRIALTRAAHDKGSSGWSVPGSDGYVGNMQGEWDVNALTEAAAHDLFGAQAETPRLFSVYNESKLSTLLIYRVKLKGISGTSRRVRLVDAPDVPWDDIPEWYIRNMLRRYYHERGLRRFGIFVGPNREGVVEVPGDHFSWDEYASGFTEARPSHDER